MNRKSEVHRIFIIHQQMQFTQQPFRIQRTFVLEDQCTLKTRVIQFQVFSYLGEIDLFPLFSFALQELKNVTIKIYDFRINKYVDLNSLGLRFHVPTSILDTPTHVILIKYGTLQSETLSIQSLGSSIMNDNRSETHSKRTQRSKERIILEVIQIVKKWRKLCETKKGVTLTLAEAAQKVGLPKKSLDDYYYQLRMGEKYGFDYHAHMMERVGVLRSFLRRYKTHRKNDKNEKLPTILKISDQIDDYQDLIKTRSFRQTSNNFEQIQDENQEALQNQEVKQESIEKDFYNEFNYNLGKEMDPFLSLDNNQDNPRMSIEDSNLNGDFEMFF